LHLLISPNAFKNSLNAEDAAAAIESGFMHSNLSCTCECFPIGDGGDGTGDLIIKKCNGTMVTEEVRGPLGSNVRASYGLIDDGKTAIIEMANASGLRLLEATELNPLIASSYGTGQQMRSAMDKGVTRIIIGMGGSATVDGGTGILTALGIRFLDVKGEELAGVPGSLNKLAFIDTSQTDQRIYNCEVSVLCDVDNFLLGEQGSAAIFGPQKGASPDAVKQLDAALDRLAQITLKQTGKDITTIKYGGAAGGAAAGLFAFLNAKLENGIDYFLQLTGFEDALQKADLVITGEGSIDEQTLQGKGPFGVAFKAKSRGLPVIAIAGKVPLIKGMDLQRYFDVLLAIGHQPTDLAAAMKTATDNLTRTSWEIGNLLAIR
jgi:glycerate kinase